MRLAVEVGGDIEQQIGIPVTGFPTTRDRSCGNTRKIRQLLEALHVRADCGQPLLEDFEIDLDGVPLPSTRMSVTRPTATPRNRTGLEISSPLTFSVM